MISFKIACDYSLTLYLMEAVPTDRTPDDMHEKPVLRILRKEDQLSLSELQTRDGLNAILALEFGQFQRADDVQISDLEIRAILKDLDD